MDDEDILAAFIDPRGAIDIKHEPSRKPKPLTSERWLSNNRHLIRQMGVEWWLEKLVYVLETGGSKTPSELSYMDFPSDLQAMVRDIV
jgi:hypothetical protein